MSENPAVRKKFRGLFAARPGQIRQTCRSASISFPAAVLRSLQMKPIVLEPVAEGVHQNRQGAMENAAEAEVRESISRGIACAF